jgi:hypothetical protein
MHTHNVSALSVVGAAATAPVAAAADPSSPGLSPGDLTTAGVSPFANAAHVHVWHIWPVCCMWNTLRTRPGSTEAIERESAVYQTAVDVLLAMWSLALKVDAVDARRVLGLGWGFKHCAVCAAGRWFALDKRRTVSIGQQ